MKLTFISSRPAALKVGGAYFGIVDRFERCADVSLKDNLLAEFVPQGAMPVCFFLSENLRIAPPEGVEVYLKKDGVALFVKDYPPCDYTLRPLFGERNGQTLATLFRQGKLQLSIESESGTALCVVDDGFEKAQIRFYGGLIFLDGGDQLAVYTKTGELLFHEKILSHSVENGVLTATMPLFDSLGRVARGEWEIKENTLTRISFSVSKGERDGEDEELLPFLFFETLLVGGDPTNFLDDSLKEKAGNLKEFIGEFVSVLPPETPNEIGVVKKKGERVFEVDYYSVQTKNGKITDLLG